MIASSGALTTPEGLLLFIILAVLLLPAICFPSLQKAPCFYAVMMVIMMFVYLYSIYRVVGFFI